jgi:hypothetical protein
MPQADGFLLSFRLAICPLPYDVTCYGSIFRLSDRCICMLLPFGFFTFLQLRGRSVLNFRCLSRGFDSGVINRSYRVVFDIQFQSVLRFNEIVA